MPGMVQFRTHSKRVGKFACPPKTPSDFEYVKNRLLQSQAENRRREVRDGIPSLAVRCEAKRKRVNSPKDQIPNAQK
eukprot:2937833-Amphidinium_carterae.1